jgi:hypothetical protein
MDEQNGGMFEGAQVIKLDGSLGLGANALVTITMKDEQLGEKEETYQIPYGILDQKRLKKFLDVNFILGFKIIKQEPKAIGGL